MPQVAAVTALIAGIMTIAMGIYAKQPFAMAAGLGVNALLATTILSTPNLTWPQIMGLVVWAGVLMTALVLTGFRTAVFEAVPESLKTAIVVGIGFFIAFIGLVNAGIIRRTVDAAHTTVPVTFGVGGHLLGWPTVVFLVGLFLTIALFIRKVRGAILYGVLASTVLSIILEAVFHIGSSKDNPTGWSLNVPAWGGGSALPDVSLLFSADMFGAFGTIGGMAATMLIFTILISAFFDAMGTTVGLATEAGTIDKDGKIENNRPCAAGGCARLSCGRWHLQLGQPDFCGIGNRLLVLAPHGPGERGHRRALCGRGLPLSTGDHRPLRGGRPRHGFRGVPHDPPGRAYRLAGLGPGYPGVYDHYFHAAVVLDR